VRQWPGERVGAGDSTRTDVAAKRRRTRRPGRQGGQSARSSRDEPARVRARVAVRVRSRGVATEAPVTPSGSGKQYPSALNHKPDLLPKTC
jgi:hypothetical protein